MFPNDVTDEFKVKAYDWFRRTGGIFVSTNGATINVMEEWNADIYAPREEFDEAVAAGIAYDIAKGE